MEYFSKIIPDALAEVRQMDYVNLLIICGTLVLVAFIWKAPDWIRALKTK